MTRRLNFKGLRLAEMIASHGADGVTFALKGSLPIDAEGKDELSGLMGRLTASPMFETANLISKQNSSMGGESAVTFSLMLKLAPMDPDDLAHRATQGLGTGEVAQAGDAR